MIDWEEEERYDKFKTRVFKYVLYKQRTEKEIYFKFKNYENADKYLEKTIKVLKELGYIDDKKYVKMYVEEILNNSLKKISEFEIRNKLSIKGINKNDIYEVFLDKDIKDRARTKEIESAINILKQKKYADLEEKEERFKIESYLYKKGYKKENIMLAKEEIEYLKEKGII